MTIITGFDLWTPDAVRTNEKGFPIYEIIGSDSQYVQLPMDPGAKIQCVAGGMAYMSNDVRMKVKFGGLGKMLGRVFGGASLFLVEYTNEGRNMGYISMTPDYPGVIIPIDMHQTPSICAARDSYVCSIVSPSGGETNVTAGFNPTQSILAVCCSGVEFIVQKLEYGELAFLMAMGTVVTKDLAPGETILVDTHSILAFDSRVKVDVRRVGGICAMCFSGEGIFNTELKGPGKVWLQSMGIDKLRKLFPVKKTTQGGGTTDPSSNN